MQTRLLGTTGLEVPILAFGASSLGQEFRSVTLDEALGSVAAALDCGLTYTQYTLQNTRFVDETIPFLKTKGIGVMNAGPFSARLLTDAPLPAWLKEPEEVKAAARAAAELCRSRGTPLAKLALQFALANPDIATTVAGSANPRNIRDWAAWAAEPLDADLLLDVQAIFAPVKNRGHLEGLACNN